MNYIRVYNPDTDKYEIIEIDNASIIKTANPNIIKYVNPDGSAKEVLLDDALNKIVEDLIRAKKNINWLALYGGGGSGTGGGGTGGGGATVISGVIKVNNEATGATIIHKDSDRLYFEIEQQIVQQWDYTVTFNDRIIKSGSISNGSVTIADLSSVLNYNNGKGTLKIVCSSGIVNIYWTGTVIDNQLELSVENVNITTEELSSSSININYRGTLIGDYILYINDIQVGTVSIQELLRQYTYQVPVGRILNASNVGSNMIISRLVKADDPTISDSVASSVVIKSDTIIISSLLSKDQANPTKAPKNSNLLVTFTVYLSTETLIRSLRIRLNNTVYYDSSSDIFNSKISEYIPTASDDLVIGNTYPLTIEVESMTGKTASETYYVGIDKSENLVLSVPAQSDLVSDFIIYGNPNKSDLISSNDKYVLNGATPVNSTQYLNIFKANAYSGIQINKESTFYRLSNKAYAVVSGAMIGGRSYSMQQLLDAKKKFTLSFTFKADYHNDDDHTLLQLGTLDAENQLMNGILISVHRILVKDLSKSVEYPITDNQLYTIDIVYDPTVPASEPSLKLYIDGVVTKASSDIRYIDFGADSNIYLGCSPGDLYYSDFQFYRLQYYTRALNDYEIVINKLQSSAYTEFNDDGLPNDTLITDGLKSNFLKYNQANKNIESSWLWDTNSNDYSLSNFVTSSYDEKTGLVTCKINENITSYDLPIPIMLLDVSTNSTWTWENFISTDANKFGDEAVAAKFSYYDQSGSNNAIIEGTTYVEIQGTSTKSNQIKNLRFTFRDAQGNSNAFAPKPTWVPERILDAKADIVDSSHSLNAASGKFINEVLANSEDSSRWFPLDSKALSKFKNSKYYQKSTVKPTMKAAVEGYPFFLIIRFYSSDTKEVIVKSLGIYQMLLGRESVHNLGLRVLDSITKGGEEIVPDKFPYYTEGVTFNEMDMNSYWIEATKTFNSKAGIDWENDDLTKSDKLIALNWQANDGAINNQYEVKYGDRNNASEVPYFKDLIESIVRCPCVLSTYFDASSNANQQRMLINGYPEMTTINGTDWTATGRTVQVTSSRDEMEALSNYLNVDSCYKQITVCLFLGLLDNFCKNDPLVLFDSAVSKRFMKLFYDMDSGAGGDNQAIYDIPAFLYLKGLINKDSFIKETMNKSDKSFVSGYDNKLIMVLENEVIASVTSSESADHGNPFSYFWISFRNYCYEKYKNRYKNLTEFFMQEYFIPQTRGCGELLFNLTYTVKYLHTSQANYLAGRRIQQVTSWLYEHVEFLDSISSWKTTDTQLPEDREETFARIYSGDNYITLPITTNRSLVIKTSDQGGSYNYFAFCQKNVETEVRYGGGTATSQAIQKIISFSNNLLKIGNNKKTFGESGFSAMDGNPLYGFNELDLQNCTSLSAAAGTSPIQFTATFYDQARKVSELRVINLSGTSNSTHTNNLTLDLTSFTKLTDIDIRNSVVGSLLLPLCPLSSLYIEGSLITRFELVNQSLLTAISLYNCIKVTGVSIRNCEQLASITGLSGLNNMTSLVIASCPVKELEISNNGLLETVELAIPTLKTLKINDCKVLRMLSLAGCTSLETIIINNCYALSSFTLDASMKVNDSITKIDLSNTAIKSVTYGTKQCPDLDFSGFSRINDFKINNNTIVEAIRFQNVESSPIPLTHNFDGDISLKRIYGHVVVTNDTSLGYGTFHGCRSFSIHGGRWKGQSVTNSSGVYRMPYEIAGYSTPTKINLFQGGSGVTNMDFEGTNANHMFNNTAVDQFDVYYFFTNLNNIKSVTGTFQFLVNKIFNWTAQTDNSPHRYMYYFADGLTSFEAPFYNSAGYHRILSPTRDPNGTLLSDNGLFSPLANITSFSYLECGSVMIDRNCFRRVTGNYALKNIRYFNTTCICDDVNSQGYMTASDWLRNAKNDNTTYLKWGNLARLFYNLPNLTDIRASFNPVFINYELTGDDMKLPDGLQVLRANFVSTYATGEIKLSNFVTENNNLRYIYHSFRQTNSISDLGLDNAVFYLNNDTFTILPKLINVGYDTSDGNARGNVDSASFTGVISRIVNITNQQFPYGIFHNNPSLHNVIRLFDNCTLDAQIDYTNLELPGTMFVGCPNLYSIEKLFYNFNADFVLSTDKPFRNCRNLYNINYLFGQDASRTTFHLRGSIPYGLFFHGYNNENQTKVITGSNDEPTITEEGDYDYSQMTRSSVTVTYRNYRRTICYARGVFQRCSVDPYINDNPEVENNEDYNPFKWIYSNGVWSRGTVNNFKETMIWGFDGVNIPSSYLNDDGTKKYEFLDEDHTNNAPRVVGADNDSSEGTLNFLCAPDLLRYCTNDAQIDYLFAYSGGNTVHRQWSNISYRAILDYGIRGRIPPYLLKPLSDMRSFQAVFYNCKRITAYEQSSTVERKIPYTFFSYAPRIINLSYAFAGMYFNYRNDFNVFTYLDNLNISRLFWLWYIEGGSCRISQLFVGKTITNLEHCFSVVSTNATPSGDQTDSVRNQNITFDGIFTKNRVSSTDSGGYKTDRHAFSGYSKGSVKFGTKTLDTLTTKYNYAYSDGSVG